MKRGLYRLVSRISENTELPLNEMCKEYSVSVIGGREISVEGVRSVLKYERECIVLEACCGNISIFGEGLEMKSYYKTALTVGGNINRVEFG